MPEFKDISGRRDLITILATMLSPTDDSLRNKIISLYMFYYRGRSFDNSESRDGEQDDFGLILSLAEDGVRPAIESATKQGVIAGDILASIYLMAEHGVEEPSLNKGIYVVRKFSKVATYGDGARMPSSEQYVRDAWKKFRSVAHYWAAYRLNMGQNFVPARALFSLRHLATFLSAAKTMQDFGVTVVSARNPSSGTLLDGDSIWSVPSDVPPLPLKNEVFPDRLFDLLKSYKV